VVGCALACFALLCFPLLPLSLLGLLLVRALDVAGGAVETTNMDNVSSLSH
jgi:hypothetical protein